ncbi:four helix bundle protein [Patescibacteria group bacterium]
MTKINSYKELFVWQKSIDLVTEIYQLTDKFPKSELYGLTNQMRRAAVSIPSNIAEGYLRKHLREYIQFLRISFASGGELETQIVIAKKLKFTTEQNFMKTETLLEEVLKMLNKLISALVAKR